jgi:hypothetical protein
MKCGRMENVRSKVSTAMIMKSVVFCDVVAAATCSSWFLALWFFYPEDGGNTIFRNVGSH